MSMSSGGSRGLSAEINVTPLIDVLLVLLIIFMVIQPALVQGLDALVPQPPKNERVEATPQPVVVQVVAGGSNGATYKINGVAFDKAAIEPKLTEIFAVRSSKVMFVKGDAGLDFSAVAEVIDDGHRAGVDNIGIVTARSSAALR
ncbi:MAG: biopolymer transporter ExbD [Acidobacteria bacterium]|nr:biopolymer transporter ExbD [Acidobacteriota bacterium]